MNKYHTKVMSKLNDKEGLFKTPSVKVTNKKYYNVTEKVH